MVFAIDDDGITNGSTPVTKAEDKELRRVLGASLVVTDAKALYDA